jgi:putative hydrolase of the HAD superfamily
MSLCPLPKAVLLDLDDTILDDSSTIDACWRQACAEHCAECGGLDPEELYAEVRRQGEWFWGEPERHRLGRLALDEARGEVVRLALARLGIESAGLAGKVAGNYSHRRHVTMEPLPDAIDTVRWLRGRGLKLALVTNGAAADQHRKIARFDLKDLFDTILVEGEVGFGKPDERIYRRALRELAVDAADAWMVGDHLEFDVAAPQQLGLFAVWVDAHGHGVPPGRNVRPNRVIRRLSELRADG